MIAGSENRTHGEEASSLIESNRVVHLLLLDLMLPKISGYILLERIKANPSHLPVVIVSAVPSDDLSVEPGLDIMPGRVFRIVKGDFSFPDLKQKVLSYLTSLPQD